MTFPPPPRDITRRVSRRHNSFSGTPSPQRGVLPHSPPYRVGGAAAPAIIASCCIQLTGNVPDSISDDRTNGQTARRRPSQDHPAKAGQGGAAAHLGDHEDEKGREGGAKEAGRGGLRPRKDGWMDGKIDGGHTDDDRLLLLMPMPTTTTEATLWCHIIIRGKRRGGGRRRQKGCGEEE